MDAFARVRGLARVKNAEGMEALDPRGMRAIDLVRVLAQRADLELHSIAPSDPLLSGALAVLARDDGAIYHVNNASEEDLAVLIGHELGHFHVHDAERTHSCAGNDVDASAPSESSPVGVDRVAGYGVRERRELLANVFARELLLPRALARRLYLDDRSTPGDIATKLGIPLGVARQQLIDALFTPELPVQQPATASVIPDLDSSQAAAARFGGKALLLEAGPGTGKTRTLVAKIVHILESGAPPSSVVALTFSNKAATELSERVASALPRAAANVWTGTFHAFGLELVRKHAGHPRLNYPHDVGIVDRSDAVGLLEDLLPILPLRHYKNYWDPLVNLKDILAAISRAKDELVTAERYQELGRAMLDRATTPEAREIAEKAIEVGQVYAQYDATLAREQLLDFGDLIMRPTLALEADPTLRKRIQLQYRHVLVDEYQDVNRASARLLRALAGDGAGLWVVGDARQSIYRFRGASSANMVRFEKDFPGAQRLSLQTNYRSSPEITASYCGFSTEMTASAGMLPLALRTHREERMPTPDIRLVGDGEEKAALAASVRELVDAGVPLRDQAVLFRTNNKLSSFATALEARGIPVLHLGSLFERAEVRDLLSLLSFVVDRSGSALVRLASLDRYRIPVPDVIAFLGSCRDDGVRALDALRNASSIEGLSEAGRVGFATLSADLDGVRPSMTAWEVLCSYLFEKARVQPVATNGDVREQMKAVAIWQFLTFAREPISRGKGSPLFRLLERIRRLVILSDERDLRQIPAAARHADAVRMLTMHGAKGLEFDAVHVPGMTKGQVPLTNRPMRCPPPDGLVEDALGVSGSSHAREVLAAEEECLYFVAMSRARSHLRHYGSAQKPSEFISRMKPALRAVDASADPMVGGEEELTWSVPMTGVPPAVNAEALDRFERCPRRYLYTHILRLGGRQHESAFLKAHDCVHDVLRSARALENPITKPWLVRQLNESWKARGPIGHPYESEYRRIAEEIISNFHEACAGRDLRKVDTLVVELDGTVHLEPDQLLVQKDGVPVLRRVKTGKLKKPAEEEDDWIYTLYHLAGTERYGTDGYFVEAVHLTSNTVTRIEPSTRKRNNREKQMKKTMGAIRAGEFPPEPDDFRCPRCPHFFYCPSLPEGPIPFS